MMFYSVTRIICAALFCWLLTLTSGDNNRHVERRSIVGSLISVLAQKIVESLDHNCGTLVYNSCVKKGIPIMTCEDYKSRLCSCKDRCKNLHCKLRGNTMVEQAACSLEKKVIVSVCLDKCSEMKIFVSTTTPRQPDLSGVDLTSEFETI